MQEETERIENGNGEKKYNFPLHLAQKVKAPYQWVTKSDPRPL